MLIELLFSSPILFVVVAAALFVAITIHEFAHAFAADKLGDPTPRLQGRLTLNPLAHLDPLGTLLLFLFGFGWGKPVQFDPYNLKNPRRDAAIISFAGPFSNIILVTILSLIYRTGILSSLFPFFPLGSLIPPLIQLNVVLAVFNLIPVHPLDGGKILAGLLSPSDAHKYDRFMSQYGLYMLLLMFLPIVGGRSLVSLFVSPIVSFLMNIYLPSSGGFV